ncbi:hypothetical protein GCM10011297_24200 [Bacterioplanes sanyensis]|uniref:TonB family protein n=1 Tax=Bacterioplanes sanyensis TaxID=1249553 RepID=UPI00167A3F0F|nr:TonB family protein [Bacterioplanes sanyensis]GGY50491.1 hypothetical protein GCM10011297_24200 [Bacterioplanes sanyensis]
MTTRLLCAALMLGLWLPNSYAQLVLNGSASYQRLTQDVYVGGLYLSQTSSDADFIRSATTAKRMRLVVVANRWSPRRWQQMWQNNISINNENLSQAKDVQTALMELTQLLREDLVKGDELVIDYQPGGDTRIYLNQQLALTAVGSELFNFLVNTWIGPLPPSREFRDRMLGKVKDERSAQWRQVLADHQIPPQRTGLYEGWLQQERQQRLAQQRAAEEARRREAERQAQLEAERKAKAQAEKARLEAERQARLAAERQAREEAERQARLAAERQAQAAKPDSQPVTPIVAASKAKPQPTAEQLQQQQSYYAALLQWRLQEAVNKEVTYPAWARQFEQEGLIQASVTLQRGGDIATLQIADNNAHKLLVSELQRAVQAVAADVSIPDELQGNAWPLLLRYRFQLADTALLPNPQPQRPSSLGPEQSSEPSVSLEDYRASVVAAVKAGIRYPKAAQILKKQGHVIVELTLAADGSLANANLQQASAHRELNQAVLSAVDAAAPFDSLPPAAGGELRVTVEHSFRP